VHTEKAVKHIVDICELDKLSKEELAKIVGDYQVFAWATQKNKLDIIEACQMNGNWDNMVSRSISDYYWSGCSKSL